MKHSQTISATVATLMTTSVISAMWFNVADAGGPPHNALVDSRHVATLSNEVNNTESAAQQSLSLNFVLHIDAAMAEQDVFYEKEAGSNSVWRPTAATRNMNAPLYAPAKPVAHNFLDTTDTGPYPKGKPLGITLGEWFAATGQGDYTCKSGKGEIDLTFTGLVPKSVYTLWHDFMVWPPTDPFIGTYDVPFGARDGSENVFTTNAQGDARFVKKFSPCLQLSGEHLLSDLAIAWHSDGKSYGPLTGEFSTNTHVHLFVELPKRNGV